MAFEEKTSVVSLRSIDTFQGAVPPSPSRLPSGYASGFPHLHPLRSLPDRGDPSRASPLTATPPSSGDDGLFEPGPGITPPAETPPLPMLAPPNPEGLRQRRGLSHQLSAGTPSRERPRRCRSAPDEDVFRGLRPHRRQGFPLRLRRGFPPSSSAALLADRVIPLPRLSPLTANSPLIGGCLVRFAAAAAVAANRD